ncbi:tetratricopeptide repeat protein [Embleya sp. NBC_00896]|uniref:tetratricopeptide repeat protein n=1 Tax=Embleya sp. NBC_00896 TaxID=2975961 RepID=UPI002F911517|nr:tetratricopeptide repeat protein [Embleya sp. NBC_00896]
MLRVVCAGAVAGALLIAVPAAVHSPGADRGSSRPPVGAGAAASADPIEVAQARLREVPDDARALADLGGAYVERARVGGDASLYARARQALDRALALSGPGTPTRVPALVALAALANARHDFATGRDLAEQAIAADPYYAPAFGALADAATQLGDAEGATRAIQRMLDLRPSVASFTRASYDLELRGDVDGARVALDRALEGASARDDVAYCRLWQGELARRYGDPAGALGSYEAGLRVVPGDPALRAGRAAALAEVGRVDEALAVYAELTATTPLPQYLARYGELAQRTGHTDLARIQFRLVTAQFAVMDAQGATDDVARAMFEADRGDPAEAVRRAEAERARRRSVHTADALAWALFRAGRAAEAVPYALEATAGGWRDPEVLAHLAAIRAAVGTGGGR